MPENDKFLWQTKEVPTINDTDRFLIVVGTSERLITKENLVKVLSLFSAEQTSKLSIILTNGDGVKFLTDSGDYKDIRELFSQEHFSLNNSTKQMEIKECHLHSNKNDVLDKLSAEDNLLKFNNKIVGEYTLPISSNTTLGGVKVDGDTIKINDGVISADVIGNWSAGANYPVGYFAVHDDRLYQCNTANSDDEWIESKWNLIDGGNSAANIIYPTSNVINADSTNETVATSKAVYDYINSILTPEIIEKLKKI